MHANRPTSYLIGLLLVMSTHTACIFGQEEATLPPSDDARADLMDVSSDERSDNAPDLTPDSGPDTIPDLPVQDMAPDGSSAECGEDSDCVDALNSVCMDSGVCACPATQTPTQLSAVVLQGERVTLVPMLVDSNAEIKTALVGLQKKAGVQRSKLSIRALSADGAEVVASSFDLSEGDINHLSAVSVPNGVVVFYSVVGRVSQFKSQMYLFDAPAQAFKLSDTSPLPPFFNFGVNDVPLGTYMSRAEHGCIAGSLLYRDTTRLRGRTEVYCPSPSGDQLAGAVAYSTSILRGVEGTILHAVNVKKVNRGFTMQAAVLAGADGIRDVEVWSFQKQFGSASVPPLFNSRVEMDHRSLLEAHFFGTQTIFFTGINTSGQVTQFSTADEMQSLFSPTVEASALGMVSDKEGAHVLSLIQDGKPYVLRGNKNPRFLTTPLSLSDANVTYTDIQSVRLSETERAHVASYKDGVDKRFHYFRTRIQGDEEQRVCALD